MHTYFGLVHQEGDSAFGVQFPDVPGCFSAADEIDDLAANAAEALSLHLEGEDLPTARPLSEIRSDPRVEEELRAGAFLIAVPVIALTGRSERINISMDAGLAEAIKKTAKARKLNFSSYLADLARRDIMG